ncbi:MAG: DNA mismatch repair protein MutS [Erysipelotrichales bacterium]|nr:DNA mismatch repair protein MutS [Erysipelotrichales bacterium]
MAEYTPMMKHYLTLKEQNPDTLIFYRLGDFYELFMDDAKIASKELDLVLTGRNAGQEDRVPMCGVPHHAVNSYIQRLIQKGYKVAIAEQLEDPAEAVGLVKRDIIRVITPGTSTDESQDERISVYLGSIYDYQYGFAVTLAELATGETKAFLLDYDETDLVQFLRTKNVREVVLSSAEVQKARGKSWVRLSDVTLSSCDDDVLRQEYEELLGNVRDSRIIASFGRLVNYLEATQKKAIRNLSPLTLSKDGDYLYMDYSTKQNLELTAPMRNGTKSTTVWGFLDHCQSSMGSRTLRRWVEYPLVQKEEILRRQDMIGWLNRNYLSKGKLKEKLGDVYDLERLISRIALGSVNAKDCLRLHKTLSSAPEILEILRKAKIDEEFDNTPDGKECAALLDNVFVDDPPVLTNEGGMFRDGYSAELDELRRIGKNSKEWLTAFEAKEKERTGIKNLRIGYNRVFGYYIEISKGNLPLVKEEWGYIRKQTLTNNERFITQELKEKEDEILHAEERAVKLESLLFEELVSKLKEEIPTLQTIAKALAKADAYYSLAEASAKPGYVKPVFSEERNVRIENGRHPILESVHSETPYIANSVIMPEETNVLMITGPNMGGKSTYMRQTVLILIMAQIGCYVPAKRCELPIFDKIFTRIGASDDILAGQSTFMVEMNEANHALKNATRNSFILFDEIGRGTATYDGMALAQAIVEYITTCIEAKTMFSTHYHELTSLEETHSTIKNVHVTVHEADDVITFLYKVKNGPADRSYGINVAKLADLPESVLERAKVLLKIMETQNSSKRNAQTQMIMMEKVPENLDKIRKLLEMTDPNAMTPIAALQFVADLKEIAGKKEP